MRTRMAAWFRPVQSLRWKLTLSFTAVTVGSLLVVGLILGVTFFSRILIPDLWITPETWMQAANRSAVPMLLGRLHQAGIRLLLGTDSGILAIVPGYAIHDELRILVENGFSPYEAIAAGTIHAAKVVESMLGEGDFGEVAVGMRADLLLLSDNPLEDVRAIQNLRGVMAAGRWYSRAELETMITIPGP